MESSNKGARPRWICEYHIARPGRSINFNLDFCLNLSVVYNVEKLNLDAGAKGDFGDTSENISFKECGKSVSRVSYVW